MSNAWKVTEAEYETAREREKDKHYSLDDRQDYYQLMRFYRGQIFIRDAVERAVKRIRVGQPS